MVIIFMKNIAIIVPSLKGGGAERVVSLLSQELSKKYNLYLIVFDSEEMSFEYGGKLIDIDIKSHSNIFMKTYNVFKRAYRVRKIKKKYKIQSSISFLGSANIVNILSRVNEKTIVSIHSNLDTEKKIILGSMNKLIYNKSDKVIGVSKGIINNLINNYKLSDEKVGYIYNPVNLSNIEQISREEVYCNNVFNQNDFTIVNMGRLTNAKGQWHLIRALSHVKREIRNIKLLILGQGELEDYLRDLVKKVGLNNNVVFLGYQKNPFKYIRKTDLFVLSSLYEGFSNAIIEAMACGTPIISTDCRSGPREIIAPGTDIEYKAKDIEYCEYGVLVPVCDGIYYDYNAPLTREEKLLAESIIKLYKDKRLRKHYSDKGKERVKDFDIENIVKEWVELISYNII